MDSRYTCLVSVGKDSRALSVAYLLVYILLSLCTFVGVFGLPCTAAQVNVCTLRSRKLKLCCSLESLGLYCCVSSEKDLQG